MSSGDTEVSPKRVVRVEVQDSRSTTWKRITIPFTIADNIGPEEDIPLSAVVLLLQENGGVYDKNTFYPWHTIQSITEVNS